MLLAGCKKDNNPTPPPDLKNALTLNINYEVDGKALQMDTVLFVNDAGYHYSVSTLQYYLSDISLIKTDSSKINLLAYHYTDTSAAKNVFTLTDVPMGDYIGICFNIGLDSTQNITGGLPAFSENQNMEWPVPMGGGYHFMKFEGNYLDYNNGDTLTGFLMHLGTNSCLVRENPLYKNFTINENHIILNLAMNLNEWFRNPSVYDFDMDGNRTMSNMMAMQKLAANGVDVFHYKN